MFARKCDRCGKLYENYYDVGGNAVYAFTRNEGGDPLDKEVYVKDLCPACMEAYRQFMDGWVPIEPNRTTVINAPDSADSIHVALTARPPRESPKAE